MIAYKQLKDAVHDEMSFINIGYIGRTVAQNFTKLYDCKAVLQENTLHQD